MNRELSNEFGKDIRNRISEKYHIPEDEFARKIINIAPSSLSRYINGKAIPPYTVALRICGALDLNINEYDISTKKMIKKESDVIDLKEEFIKLGIIEEGETISEQQLVLLRGVLASNKAMFQNIDTLVVKNKH